MEDLDNANLIHRVEVLETEKAELADTVDRLIKMTDSMANRVLELQLWRDTGALHKQCGVCQQMVMLNLAHNFVRHLSGRVLAGGITATCGNSGGYGG